MLTFTRDEPDQVAKPARPGLWRGRRLTWRASLVLLTLVAFGLLGGFVRSEFFPAPSPEEATTAEGRQPPPTGDAMPDSTVQYSPSEVPSCGGWAYRPISPAELVTAPVTSWSLVGGMAAPADAAVGPASSSPVRYCYARTPAGALFAIANFLAQLQDPAATPASEIQLASYTMTPGPLFDSYVAAWANPKPVQIPSTVVPIPAEFAAFHFQAFTPDIAVIDIASRWNGHLDAASYTAHFASGDWTVDPPENGRWNMRQLPILDTNYWTPWSAA